MGNIIIILASYKSRIQSHPVLTPFRDKFFGPDTFIVKHTHSEWVFASSQNVLIIENKK